MVMFTSFNRMSYVSEKDFCIHNEGDLIHHNIKAHPMGKNYNFATAVYDSCIAIQSIESILKSKNVKYEFLQSVKHDFYYENFEAKDQILENLDYCLDLFKYPIMENWVHENYDFLAYKFKKEDQIDAHPKMKHHFDYVKEFFPQYITDKVIEYYNINQEKFTDSSVIKQNKLYQSLTREFFKSKKIIING